MLSAAKHLARWATRCFAALSMTTFEETIDKSNPATIARDASLRSA
jgi:hypothetical protein